jgi:site-specific DNA-methyltransferase (adenine-specific)
MEINKIYQGDCLELLKGVESDSVDAVITDPPYGTTACAWDIIIPFEPMWEQLKRITKKNGAIVLFGSQPFSSALVMSNLAWFRYELIWQKDRPTGLFTAKIQPMKYHENLLVFGKGRIKYNPQMLKGVRSHSRGRNLAKSNHYGNSSFTDTTSDMKYPKSILEFNREHPPIHPTQKPIALMEYLIKTYTNERELVLDFACGSGTTCVAAKNISRNYIGIELNPDYVKIAEDRVRGTTPPLFAEQNAKIQAVINKLEKEG